MTEQPSWIEVVRNLALIGLTIGVAYVVSVTIGIDTLRESVAGAGWYAIAIVIFFKASTIVVAPLGGTIIYPIAGAVFGFWPGLVITLCGDALGSTIAFFISRFFGRSVLHYFTVSSQNATIDAVLGQLSDWTKFAKARVYFAGFMDLFAYASGLTTIPYWYFIVVHMAVHAPVAAIYVLFGELIVSGAWIITVPLVLGSTALALFGAWRFHADLGDGT
jgi:uncharacterized membrane protein YdjX (TVP38/TMEM64 family)